MLNLELFNAILWTSISTIIFQGQVIWNTETGIDAFVTSKGRYSIATSEQKSSIYILIEIEILEDPFQI